MLQKDTFGYTAVPLAKPVSSTYFVLFLCIFALAIRDNVVIIYYHVRLKTQSPKHTDLYFNCGVELAQSQQQQRPPAAHKQDTGTYSV